MKTSDFNSNIFSILLTVVIFFTTVTFGQISIPGQGISTESVIKFFVIFFGFIIASAYSKVWIPKLFNFQGLFLFLLFGLMTISCFWSPPFIYSLRASLTIIFATSVVIASASCIKPNRFFLSLFWVVGFISLCSLMVYFIVPSFGRNYAWDGDIKIIGKRLSGVMGNANDAGFISAAGLIFTYICIHFYKMRISLPALAIIIVEIINLFLSGSRGSLMSLTAAIGFIIFSRPSISKLIFLMLASAFAMLVYIYIDINTLSESFIRQGSKDITSDRSDIWKIAFELIGEKPWLGWGYGSSPIVLPQYAHRIGHAPPHTHNLWIQLTFSLGYSGLFIFAALITITISKSIIRNDRISLSLLLTILVHGLIEPSIFQGVANMDNILFAICLSRNYIFTYETSDTAHQQRLPGSVAT